MLNFHKLEIHKTFFRLLARHDIIEKRKEWLENCNKEQQKEKMKQHELREREKKKQEEARLKEEWDKRERRRKEEEIRDIQAKHTQDKIAQLKNTEFGKKVKYFEPVLKINFIMKRICHE